MTISNLNDSIQAECGDTEQEPLGESCGDNATMQAFHFLEAHRAGLYGDIINEALCRGGCILQTPSHFVAGYMEGDTFYIIYAGGNLKEIMGVGYTYSCIMGYKYVSFNRAIVGKHEHPNRYKMTRFAKYEQ